ncbi:MAG TPA: DUF1289 domain-containing protein [Pseudomonadales bacterium]
MSDMVASPCIRQCTLNEHDVCVGCYRTVDEITGWVSLDNAERRAVLEQATVRRQAGPHCDS